MKKCILLTLLSGGMTILEQTSIKKKKQKKKKRSKHNAQMNIKKSITYNINPMFFIM